MNDSAVLFADIAGSTRLYEELGDAVAKQLIDEVLESLTLITQAHGGRVIKTIGDEIMCVFGDAVNCFNASVDMQQCVDEMPAVKGSKRQVRIGFHAGPLIEENGDVFGDTVNVAARIAGIARGQQVMTSRSTVNSLPLVLINRTRDIAAVSLKGKIEDVAVCEVLWQDRSDLTLLASVAPGTMIRWLTLRHGNDNFTSDAERPTFRIGRDPGSDIVIADALASRHHAQIEKRGDKFYLSDRSTNGTFVTFAGEREISLRREELMLRSTGAIRFRRSAGTGTEERVEFTVYG